MPTQVFDVEVVFMREANSELDVCQEQDRRIFDSSQAKQRSTNLTVTRSPSSFKKTLSKKAPVRGAPLPAHAQKNLQQSVMVKGDTVPLYNPPPIYPREARRKKIQGIVFARLSVTALGSVGKVTILPPHTNPLLEEAVLYILPHWRFVPRAQLVDIPIEFRLD
jgi:TonB family protein